MLRLGLRRVASPLRNASGFAARKSAIKQLPNIALAISFESPSYSQRVLYIRSITGLRPRFCTSMTSPASSGRRMSVAWPEDRALLGSNPSAVPGAKTESVAARCRHAVVLVCDLLLSGLASSDKPIGGQMPMIRKPRPRSREDQALKHLFGIALEERTHEISCEERHHSGRRQSAIKRRWQCKKRGHSSWHRSVIR